MEPKELGIYIHIPFCKKKCYYCDFISYQGKTDLIEKYIESICLEIENWKKGINIQNIHLFLIFEMTTLWFKYYLNRIIITTS